MNLGISSAHVYFLGGEKHTPTQLLGNAIFFALCFGGGPALLLLVLSPWLRNYFLTGITDLHLYLMVPLIPFLIFHDSVHHHFLLAHRRMLRLSCVRVIRPHQITE